MNKKPLISIITSFLNTEDFIQEAIESVVQQTYENWQLLLINDGSTDNSKIIALHYVQQYPSKIQYLEHEGCQNLGTSASRNCGIRYSQGEYITFLDADDVWLSHNLEHQIDILNNKPEIDMIYGSTLYWYSWTGQQEDSQKDFCDQLADLAGNPETLCKPPTLLISLLEETVVPCICSLVIRRTLVNSTGGFEESFGGMYDDQVFLVKVLLRANVFVTNEYFSLYRRHPKSCYFIAQKTNQEGYFRSLFLNWVELYLLSQRAIDARIQKTLNKQLFPYRNPALHRLNKFANSLIPGLKNRIKSIIFRSEPSPLSNQNEKNII